MASNTNHRALLGVQSTDQDAAPAESSIDLSDYDQSIPGLFVPVVTFFALPASIGKDKIVASLRKGLEHTLATIPVFAGKLYRDPDTDKFHILRRWGDTTNFVVHDLELSDPTFPSFEQWSKSGFPNHEILARSAHLSPPGSELGPPPMYLRLEDGCPMFIAQLNFVQGGAILWTAFHHLQGDATSNDMFMQCWAENSKSIWDGQSTLSSFQPSFDRQWFNAGKVPNTEEVRNLKQIVPGYRFVDISPSDDAGSDPNLAASTADEVVPDTTNPAAPMPTITSRMYHLSASKCQHLKDLCKPVGSGQYISTYDCIIALVWRAITRARLPTHPEWNLNTQTTQFQHAVNMRSKFDVIPNSYIGNGVAMVIVGPVTVASLLEPQDGLRSAALTCRQSIHDVDEGWIIRTAELAAGVKGKEKMEMNVNFMFGSDVSSSSWTKYKAYEAHDFGFGLPLAFRAAFPAMDGVVLLYPANPSLSDQGGYTMSLALEASCQDRVLQDAEFMNFFEVRESDSIV